MINSLETFKRVKKLLNQEFVVSKNANDKLDAIEKSLKALEIIKNKIVLIDVLFDTDTLEDYNDFKSKQEQLTQEEYDLLREVML